MLEDLGVVAATCWVQELLDPKKATYPLMYESGAEYSWYGSSDNLKEELLGFMTVHDLAESLFSSVTAQLQLLVQIGMSSAAAIRYMARNGLLDQPNTNKEMSDKKTSLFHYFPEELHITAIMYALQEDSATRQLNTDAMDRYSNAKQERDNLVNQEGL